MQPPLHRRVHTLPSPLRRRSEGENRFIPEDPCSVRFYSLMKTDATASCCLRVAKDFFFFFSFLFFLSFSSLSFLDKGPITSRAPCGYVHHLIRD
ncbi:uncharacterized protein BO66DRAFT_153295 [Aspergillus aculeatinus CBS 121060]|uniref:Uncharacterized protein n=1 Tax=Aspergillus aculeatinus CBS 121060 TaxID=1448322 RepID=A0ACD1H1Q8_9EURO|nr:hypothetical protein BO66DRAFT_153295 [Aspergillus aculeatinus CBS 121060]RAH67541.1 hypothetical protein BO66DRAFT_153295 [Aspergillus aculeatinus CBS 121060]